MSSRIFIKEIFESTQGEGLYAGVNQLFIRFSKCNLKCAYCDTDFKSGLKEYGIKELLYEINKYGSIHSISLTGGEPLCEAEFLKEFLPLCASKKIYLETNGTLPCELEQIINYIDIIAMDIKLPSACGGKDLFEEHSAFIDIAIKNKKEIFLKIVFDEKITHDEIIKSTSLARKNDLIVVLQPKTECNFITLASERRNKIFHDFLSEYKNIRLIPQIHKFMNIR